jgi:hypothetical protein
MLLGADGDLHLWDVATGKKVAHLKNHPGDALFFTPDGSTVGVGSQNPRKAGILTLVHWPSGSWRALPVDPWTMFAALSRDGRLGVFVPRGHGPQSAHLRDLCSGKRLAPLPGHRGPVFHAAFSPDGQYLVTGGDDGTILIWDLKAPLRIKPDSRPLNVGEAEALWADLGNKDLARAVAAIDRLAEVPGAAMALLGKHLQPLSAKNLERWLADLDSNKFAQRDQAMRELSRLEFAAEKALRQLLEARPPLEVRLRVEKLVKDLEEPISSPGLLASRNAIMVLEQINSSAARDLLESLARGAPEARLTRDARAALQRLALR